MGFHPTIGQVVLFCPQPAMNVLLIFRRPHGLPSLSDSSLCSKREFHLKDQSLLLILDEVLVLGFRFPQDGRPEFPIHVRDVRQKLHFHLPLGRDANVVLK